MAKERPVVNEYIVPGGMSGVAVRRACELVLERPGLSQKELLLLTTGFSGLNLSTAGWLTSPGNPWNGKSPATRLWERRKEGVFSCYPNEFTDKVVGAQDALFDEIVTTTMKQLKGTKFRPVIGDLVRVDAGYSHLRAEGIIIGYTLGHGDRNGPVFNSVEETLKERRPVHHGDRVWVRILDNSTGQLVDHYMIGALQPL